MNYLVERSDQKIQREFSKSQLVSIDGRDSDGLYYIEKGYARVIFRMQNTARTIQILQPGDIFKSSGTQSTIYALSSLSVRFFPRAELEKAVTSSSEFALNLLQFDDQTHSFLQKRIWTLQNFSVRARVAGLLMCLQDHFATEQKGQIVQVDRPIMAELAGTAPETLSRTLTAMENDKAIMRKGRDIFIIDPSQLDRESS